MPYYADTSAVMKLIQPEQHTEALRDWWNDQASIGIWSSDLLAVELLRAVQRLDRGSDRMIRAREVLRRIPQIGLDPAVCGRAAMIGPPLLRSLDALHLAAAQELELHLDGIVTYDDRLADAANHHGIPVATPV